MVQEKYDMVTEPAFATDAAATFSVNLLPSAAAPAVIDLRGPCPRCTHQMNLQHPILIVKGVDGIDEAMAEGMWELMRQRGHTPEHWDVAMTCTCTATHKGRPEGEAGCGAYWGMTVEREGSGHDG